MLKKSLKNIVAVAALSTVASISQAAIVVTGGVENATGALLSLAGPGTAFDGGFEMTGTDVNSGMVLLAGFCFNSDATGAPPASASCPSSKSAVPVLATGQASYDGSIVHPAGTTFQQAGSDFDGEGGTMKLIAYSPSFNVNILLDLVFDDIDPVTNTGTGTMVADAGILGTASGTFTYVNEVPVPAAAWLFGSALVGLAGVGRRRKIAA